ncbi:MAG: hypothetical protein NTU44_11375 [Bacteroidetes bacterium]|nr:hypothetical protein [Bacteroidota bacterium]
MDTFGYLRFVVRVVFRMIIRLQPKIQLQIPVLFVIYLSCLVITLYAILYYFLAGSDTHLNQAVTSLWLVLLFANGCEAFSEVYKENRQKK